MLRRRVSKIKLPTEKKRTHCRFLNYHPPAKLREGNVFSRYQIIYQTIIKCLGTPSHIDLHPPPTWEPYHHPSTHMGTSPQRDPHLPTHMWTLPEGPRSPTHMWTLPHRDLHLPPTWGPYHTGTPSPTHMGTLLASPTHMGTSLEGPSNPPPTWGPYQRDPHGDLTTIHMGTFPTHMGTSLQRDPPIPDPRGDLTRGTHVGTLPHRDPYPPTLSLLQIGWLTFD